MAILGICGINGTFHDSGACLLLDNGEWVAVEEERFNRIKHSSGFPALSVEWCLKQAGLPAAELDAVAFPFDMRDRYSRYFAKTVSDNQAACADFFCHGYKAYRYWANDLNADMAAWLGIPEDRIHAVRHHRAHAASAFYPSGFESAAVLVVDGVGEAETASYFVGRGRTLERYGSPMFYPVSIGMLYNYVAAHLGLGLSGGSGKLMGLAPYGRPVYADVFREIVLLPKSVDDRAVVSFNTDFISYHLGGGHAAFTPLFEQRLCQPRHKEEPITQQHADIAASIQLVFEDCLIFMAKQLRLISGERRLCYAGGCALNIDANTRIRNEAGFDDVFIMPSAYDAGSAIGAAMDLHYRTDLAPVRRLVGAYKGPSFSSAEIRAVLEAAKVSYTEVDEPDEAAAQLLSEGAIIGWFQGAEEIGPRALGSRSILMDPGIHGGKDIINARIKYREAFRPFAPSVPLEDAGTFFKASWPSPYMLYAYEVRDEWKTKLAAINHVDGSARVHTVASDENTTFHGLLKRFGARSGYPVLLNTSLNVQGQPLVASPEQAVELFVNSKLDALVIGKFVLSRFDRSAAPYEVSQGALPPGVVDPGGAPAFPKFEVAPAPAPRPDDLNISDVERAILRQHLEKLGASARKPAVALMARWIDTVEADLQLQTIVGTEGLSVLWQALAESCIDRDELDRAIVPAAQDAYLHGRLAFPGMTKPSGAARSSANATKLQSEAPKSGPAGASAVTQQTSEYLHLVAELRRQQAEIERLQSELADRGRAVEQSLQEVSKRDALLMATQEEVNRRDVMLAERNKALDVALQGIADRDRLLNETRKMAEAEASDAAAHGGRSDAKWRSLVDLIRSLAIVGRDPPSQN